MTDREKTDLKARIVALEAFLLLQKRLVEDGTIDSIIHGCQQAQKHDFALALFERIFSLTD